MAQAAQAVATVVAFGTRRVAMAPSAQAITLAVWANHQPRALTSLAHEFSLAVAIAACERALPIAAPALNSTCATTSVALKLHTTIGAVAISTAGGTRLGAFALTILTYEITMTVASCTIQGTTTLAVATHYSALTATHGASPFILPTHCAWIHPTAVTPPAHSRAIAHGTLRAISSLAITLGRGGVANERFAVFLVVHSGVFLFFMA